MNTLCVHPCAKPPFRLGLLRQKKTAHFSPRCRENLSPIGLRKKSTGFYFCVSRSSDSHISGRQTFLHPNFYLLGGVCRQWPAFAAKFALMCIQQRIKLLSNVTGFSPASLIAVPLFHQKPGTRHNTAYSIIYCTGARRALQKALGFAHLPFGSVRQPGTIPLENLMSSSSNSGCRAVVQRRPSVHHGRFEARFWASLRPTLSFRCVRRLNRHTPPPPENFTIILGRRGMLISSASIFFLQIFPFAHSIPHAGENRKHHR